jgi:hypothetical protein
MAGIENLI